MKKVFGTINKQNLKTKKIAIIGKDSFIGAHLFKFLEKFSYYKVVGTTLETLDITNPDAIKTFILTEKCDVIILLAGSKNIKELESNKEYAYNINVKPVETFVKNITKERFIYFSSDYVFDGQKGMYKTSDKTCPNTIYGENKVQAEELIQKSDINYAIVRTAAVLGEKSIFLSWLIETLTKEKSVEMFEDSYFTPTCINFLSEIIDKIINDNSNKIYHVIQEKKLSRYELAHKVKQIINSQCEIIPIKKSFVDHSLIQCDFVKNANLKSFDEYLKEELCIKK